MLISMPNNPIPHGIESGMATMRDGVKIRYAIAPAQSRPTKGTLLILSGRTEPIEKYFETIEFLTHQGFQIAIFDWRGQGGSDRLLGDHSKGYVDSFNSYAKDLEELFETIILPDCRPPFFVTAHSTGSLIALLAAPMLMNRVERMVLSAPFLALPSPYLTMKRIGILARIATILGMGENYMSGGPRPKEIPPFSDNIYTSSHKRFMRNMRIFQEHPMLAIGGPTYAWLYGASQAAKTVSQPKFMRNIRIPILFVAAGNDKIVSTKAIEYYARHLRSASFLTIDGAKHEIFQEADIYREQLLAALLSFIPGDGQAIY